MNARSQFSFDVFLSHNSGDKTRVRRLAERLQAAGLKVWFDEWKIKPGDDIYLAIERGLDASRALVLCLSPGALGSDWVALERSTVLFRDPSNAGRRFIPILLSDCDLPDTLRRYKYVDFRLETETAFEELLIASRPEPDATSPVLRHEPKDEARTSRPPVAPSGRALLEKKIKTSSNQTKWRSGWTWDLAVSPDSQWLVAARLGHDLCVIGIEEGSELGILRGHTNDVNGVCITADGSRIVSASSDCTLRVWDAKSYKHLATLEGHLGAIRKVVALKEENRVLSASFDATLRLWDLSTGKCLLVMHSDVGLFSVAVAEDGLRAIAGQANGKIGLWNLETGERTAIMTGHARDVESVQITPDGRHAISGSEDNTCKIWKLDTGSCLGTLEGHSSHVQSVAVSPDGALIATAGFIDRTIRLWDFRTGTCLQVIDAIETPISLAFTPDGRRLIAGTTDQTIHLYRLTADRPAVPTEPSRRYVNAKVVLVGESGVGKSALAHRLLEDDFIPTASTHGMHIWRLDLRLDSTDNLEREALLWDLAGQQDYRLTHRLFLDETALALILFNPQAPDAFAEPTVWLKVLRSAVPKDEHREITKLLIAARVDVGGVTVSQRKIDHFLEEHGLGAYLPTSAKRGDNCSDRLSEGKVSALKHLISKHVPWDKLAWTSTPRLVADLKNAVTAMMEQHDIRLLRFAELVQRLKQTPPMQHFADSDLRTAVTLLANQGIVMPLKFGDLVLLRPEVFAAYAAAVIRAAREHTDEIGCVKEQAVFDRTINFEGVARLEAADEELLMRAMVQTFLDKSLCIAEETPEGRHLIFPSQYRLDRPIPTHPNIFVSYTFTGEWQTIYTTLVVRLWYSCEFQHRELWRNAAEFETSKGRTVGLLVEHMGEGVGTISTFFDTDVPDELKVIFIEYVHRHLEKYASDVTRDRRYVCSSCAKPVMDLSAVRERIQAKKDFIYCQKCDEKVPLIDHIEMRLASDPVARRVLHMDEKATRELDAQALEQILTGHMMAICGEANQIFRELTKFDYGIDGEVEFKSNDGSPSGRKIYVQLKSGASYLRIRQLDQQEIFDLKNPRHLEYWVNQPVDVYLVIRDEHEIIRWMNVTHYLKTRDAKASRQIVFQGEKLDAPAIWRARDRLLAQ
jgi:WD40 repeat protein